MESELAQIIEECVSFIGVDVNLADVHLLSRVTGLTNARAQAIINYRNGKKNGILNLEEISKIKGIGPKSFRQAAGFLRINNSNNSKVSKESNPLDNTWIHPEDYDLGWFH